MVRPCEGRDEVLVNVSLPVRSEDVGGFCWAIYDGVRLLKKAYMLFRLQHPSTDQQTRHQR